MSYRLKGNDAKTEVINFLKDNQGKFEIGAHPLSQFLDDNNIDLGNNAKTDLKRIQRLYQVSPGDEAMIGLAAKGFDSAHSITQYEEQEFIEQFKEDMGGEEAARLTYAKANQIHSTVLNAATTYLTYKTNPPIYALSGKQNTDDNAGEVIAYPTLDDLFGEMDFCSCEHCRSVLSPAAYLVDLLQFIDLNKTNSNGQSLPTTVEKENNPLDVLLRRRPDIEHIQLTCENTNTILPYIDLVNEILEYYVVNDHSIADFAGHNIEKGVTTQELLANPQFVCEKAYDVVLKNQVYPGNLPFNLRLATLREYFDHLKVPLHAVMETVRVNDDLDVETAIANPPSFAWRDIHLESLGISREEYLIFTNSAVKKLPAYFGGEENEAFLQFDGVMANAKTLAKNVGVTFKELVEIVKTQFINSNNQLIPKLEKLGVNLYHIKALIDDGTDSDAVFSALLPEDIDLAPYGGNIKQWLKDNYDSIAKLILLTSGGENAANECDFGSLELKYALPVDGQNRLQPIDYWKLFRFIRLWKKLGWSIEETDKAITALYNPEDEPPTGEAAKGPLEKLDDRFADLLVKLAHVKRVRNILMLTKKGSLIQLLGLWSNIDTSGNRSLYRQMFLSPYLSELNKEFQEDEFGYYLTKNNKDNANRQNIIDHQLALQAAFNLTDEDFTQVFTEIGFDTDAPLSLENISHIYRYAFLARSLRISMGELIAVKQLSGIEPFSELEPVNPSILEFIQLVKGIKESEFKIQELNYVERHIDETGKAQPKPDEMLALARTLRETLATIEQEYVIEDDPTGELAQAKMTLIYGAEAAEKFFGLLNGTSSYSVGYSHAESDLEPEITAVNARLGYDDLAKKLLYQGIMTTEQKNALVTIADVSNEFKNAIQTLFETAENDFRQFFQQYSDLKSFYEKFVVSELSINSVFEFFLKPFKEKAKRLAVQQTMTSLTGADQLLINSFLEEPLADGKNYILHAEGKEQKPSIQDFIDVEEPGVSAEYFYGDVIIDKADIEEARISTIAFTGDLNNRLPENPTGASISARWRFYLTVPANQNYNFYVETDPGALVKLSFDGTEQTIVDADGNGTWRNKEAISLVVGKLYSVELTITGVKNIASLKWASHGLATGIIPDKHLYPFIPLQNFIASYTRLLKSLLIAENLGFGLEGMQFVSNVDALKFNNSEGDPKIGLFNRLPIRTKPNIATVRALFKRLVSSFKLVHLNDLLKSNNGEIFDVLNNPGVKDSEGEAQLLLILTGWTEKTKQALLQHFRLTETDLGSWENLLRLQRAYVMIENLGVPAKEFLQWVTNDPDAEKLQQVQNSLRAKYERTAWFDALQPINDKLRSLQRDALLAYVLHQMQQTDTTKHIDTADKLFEYFLIDVEMDPCMKTSRIKQAISTVQLFIQRCLMNLEINVESSSIKVKQWEWMKRYRVWEANRKVFLYPENWMEPELRDNKSPFFKDFESELLQSDINEDRAHAALIHYLEKLDEVAKLEISGMYLQENDAGKREDDIMHVFGRTPGMNRKYFYRRYEYGHWTPWEKVDLDIEDNPILPVVWNGRLFLFWLNIIIKGDTSSQSSSNIGKLVEIDASELAKLPGDTKVKVEVNLSWSEYYNNKCQPRMTSDFDSPINLGVFGLDEFERKNIVFMSGFNSYGELLIFLNHKQYFRLNSRIIVNLKNEKNKYFKLSNKHSTPIQREEDSIADRLEDDAFFGLKAWFSRERTFDNNFGELDITYSEPHVFKQETDFTHKVLQKSNLFNIKKPNHDVTDVFETSFFYQDRKHAFIALTTEEKITIADWNYLGVYQPVDIVTTPIFPEIWVQPKNDLFDPVKAEALSEIGTIVEPNNTSPVERVILADNAIEIGNVRIGSKGMFDSRALLGNLQSRSTK